MSEEKKTVKESEYSGWVWAKNDDDEFCYFESAQALRLHCKEYGDPLPDDVRTCEDRVDLFLDVDTAVDCALEEALNEHHEYAREYIPKSAIEDLKRHTEALWNEWSKRIGPKLGTKVPTEVRVIFGE